MITDHTPETLRAFSEEMAAAFNAGKIRAPVHLDGGNEEQLIEVFRDIRPCDWVCGAWRMMAKALLKGVSVEEVRAAVLAGKSITLTFPEHRVISSAIVGGILPIALGIAWGIKRSGGSERVFCWLGDMTATTGLAHECLQYASGHELPITWVIERNGKSVCTPTQETWGKPTLHHEMIGYSYDLPWPHSGAGVRVNF